MENNSLILLEKELKNIKNINTLIEYKEKVDALFEGRISYIEMLDTAMNLSKKGFGFIKESFEEISPLLHETSDGRNILKRYINTIKNDNNLSKAYSIFESIYHAPEGVDASFMVDSLFENTMNKKQYDMSVSKLGNLLSEAFILLNAPKEINIDENTNVNESIYYLMVTKKKPSTLGEVSIKRNIVSNFLNENAGKNVRNNSTNENNKKISLEKLVSDFNKKYSNEDFTNSLKESIKYSEKSFYSYKENCINLINKVINENENNVDVDRLIDIKNSLAEKKYNKDTVYNDIAQILEITDLL